MNPTDLLRGEKVLVTAHLHPWFFMWERPVLFLLGILTLGLIPYFYWKFTILYVTSLRIVLRTGILARDLVDLDFRKINQVVVKQSLTDRLFGYGHLSFVSNDQYALNYGPVSAPALLRRVVQEQVYAVAA